MSPVKTWTQEQINIDFNLAVYDKLRSKYENLTDFLERLKSFTADLASNKNLYNINPFPDRLSKEVYILGKCDSELGIFPEPHLALKCSLGKAWAEDLRKQFYRSIHLAQEFETKLNNEEKIFFRFVQSIFIFKLA